MRLVRDCGWIFGLLMGLCLSSELPAAEEQPVQPALEDAPPTETASEEIETTLERRDRLLEGIGEKWAPDWLKELRQRQKDLFDWAGLEFALAYDTLAMAALGGGDALSAASGELSLTGRWAIAGEERGWPLDLHFRVRSRQAFGSRAPSFLAGDIGALWGVTDGFTDRGFEIPDFYLKQRIFSRELELRYGQLSIENQMDRHALRGAKQAFVNRAFSSNPAVAFPRFGAGATLHWKSKWGFDLTGGVTTVQATTAGDQVDFSFGSSDLFAAVQAGYDFEGVGDDPARAQLMAWHSDAIDDEDLPSAWGFSLTLEQALTASRTQTFARVAWADGGGAEVSHLFAAGAGKTFREFDLLGIAVGAGRSSTDDHEWQAVMEGFYRWQIIPACHITPSVQILAGDGFRGGGDLRLIPGLRGQLSF